jgi:hypothetical protein
LLGITKTIDKIVPLCFPLGNTQRVRCSQNNHHLGLLWVGANFRDASLLGPYPTVCAVKETWSWHMTHHP